MDKDKGKLTMAKVLIIGDLHEPVSHPAYLRFCQDIYEQWDCDTVVFIGDVVDFHAISFHTAHPECHGPADEYKLASEKVEKWNNVFPVAYVCIGNHDERVIRLAQSVNIPSKFLRNYQEAWKTPAWNWDYEFQVDDVCYYHGTGTGGIHPAYNAMRQRLMSVCIGHCHSSAGIKFLVNPHKRIFGMDVGTGIDVRAFQFAYGRHMVKKPVLSCGVVLDGIPYLEVMPAGDGELYDRRNFEGKQPSIRSIVKRRNREMRTGKKEPARDANGRFCSVKPVKSRWRLPRIFS